MDSRPVRFRGECTENQSVCCTTELCLSVDKLKTKKKTSTGNQLLKLRILTPLLDWKRCSKALSRHHSSVVPIFVTRTIQDSKSKFLRERLCSQSIEIFREDICSVVHRVHSTQRLTFLSYPLLYCKASYFDVLESAWSLALYNMSCRV